MQIILPYMPRIGFEPAVIYVCMYQIKIFSSPCEADSDLKWGKRYLPSCFSQSTQLVLTSSCLLSAMLSCLQEPHAELLPNQPLLGSITAFDQDADILVSPYYTTASYMVNQRLTQLFNFGECVNLSVMLQRQTSPLYASQNIHPLKMLNIDSGWFQLGSV